MAIETREDVKLAKAEEAFRALADCVVEMMQLRCLPPSTCWPLEWLLLLHCRSAEVLVEFSEYYCLKLLLDRESPLATYFIDLFHQLEWLLKTQLALVRSDTPLPQPLYSKINDLLQLIEPATDTCRFLFTICRFSPTLRSKWFPTGIEMKRKADDFREFSRDHDRSSFKMLPFTDLDQSDHNRIELGESLGEGGFAIVYKGNFWAWNKNDQCYRVCGDPVAVKVFGADRDTKPAGQGYLRRMKNVDENLKKISLGDTSHLTETKAGLFKELWNLMSAKHPNIVSPKGYVGKREQKGEAGLVMELMDTSLKDFLQGETEPLGDVVMIDLMLEIARGARFLQECGLVHKDLKSQNILLRSTKVRGIWKEYPAAEVKLADFGLTQCIVQDAQPSADTMPTQGTFCYMAPECLKIADFKGHSYEDKVDVFSYGTICFDILACGDPDACQFTSPYGRTKALELFYKAVKSGEWRERVKGKSEYLVDLIARCWDFDASKRPTFATICSFLQHALRCALSPPVIQVTTWSNLKDTSKSSLLNFFRTIMWDSDTRYGVIGTTMLDSCLEVMTGDMDKFKAMKISDLCEDVALSSEVLNCEMDMTRDMNEFETMEISDLKEDVALFSEVLNCEMTAAKEKEKVGVSCPKQSTTERNRMQLKPMKTDDDGVYTPEIFVKVQDQRFRIPFKIMDTDWIVFKALIWSSMLSHFPFLDHERDIQSLLGSDGRLEEESSWGSAYPLTCRGSAKPLKNSSFGFHTAFIPQLTQFAFNNDASRLQLDVDTQLIPLLVCFWEGYIGPSVAFPPVKVN